MATSISIQISGRAESVERKEGEAARVSLAFLPLQGIVRHAHSSPPRILREAGCRGDIPALRLASSFSFFQSELFKESRDRRKVQQVTFVRLAPSLSSFNSIHIYYCKGQIRTQLERKYHTGLNFILSTLNLILLIFPSLWHGQTQIKFLVFKKSCLIL